MGNRRLWAILVLIVMLFAFAMPSAGNLLSAQRACKIPFAGPVHNIDTGLNCTNVEAGQADIVEHRITTAELERMKQDIGVCEQGRNYDLIFNGHGTGLAPPTEEDWTQIAAKAMVVENVSRGPASEPYFSSVDWSTSPWFPPIGDQDGQGSCVSWAVGYYTKTFQEAIEHGWNLTGAQWVGVYGGYPTPEYQDKIISPAFVYHLTNWGIDAGSSYYHAINLVCSIGACSWTEMPWDPSDNITWPSEDAWREAAYYRGASTQFEWIYVNPPSGILDLKNLIASGNLAQIVMDADQYQNLTSEDVWTVDNYIPQSMNHANTIVGYDDNMTYLEGGSWSKGAFKIANSWGVGGWENVPDGFYWISYEAMSQIVQYATFYRDRIAYVPTLTSSFRMEHPVRGAFEITVGMGTHDNPDVSKNFTDYVCGGNFSFCPNNIVFDITEFKDVVPNVYGQLFFMEVYDWGTSTTGTVLYFAVEDATSSDYTSSLDPPVITVNFGYVFADLIFGSWPMFHRDLTHNGYSTLTAPNTNQTLWNYTTGDGVSSSPAVVDGMVFVGSSDGKLYALNATTGTHIWNYTIGNLVSSSPAVAGGVVYVGSWDGNVYGLNATTGAQLWNYTAGAVVSSPAVAGGVVYVGSLDNNKTYALNAATGALIWDYTTGDAVWSSPAVADGVVYVGSGDRNVYALNATTGAQLWNCTTGWAVHSSPAVADGVVYVGSYDNRTYALNATTGAQLWNYTTGDAVAWSSPAVAGDVVYVGSGDSKLYALNAVTGALVWSYTTGSWVWWGWSSPAVAGGVVYVGSGDGNVYAFGVHDIAVNVAPPKTVVGQAFGASINVKVANQGGYTETFIVTAYANATTIQTETPTLTSQDSTTLTFTWNTTGFAYGNYTISIYASPVAGETLTADNNYVFNVPVHVGVPGDVSGDIPGAYDGIVNMKDIAYLVSLFRTKPTKPPWHPNADINNDDVVDMKDIAIAIYYFNQRE